MPPFFGDPFFAAPFFADFFLPPLAFDFDFAPDFDFPGFAVSLGDPDLAADSAGNFYFSNLTIVCQFNDPANPNFCFFTDSFIGVWKSVDGGKNFSRVTTPHGDDHDLWIDQLNPQRMIEGNDGGACVTFNQGESWSTLYNQLTGQFYHVTRDTVFPGLLHEADL